MRVYESILETQRQWRFDGVLKRPTYEDVATLLDRMIEQVRKSPGSISIESGGILVKRTDNMIDVYVHAGGFK
jgi:hypothetical protein